MPDRLTAVLASPTKLHDRRSYLLSSRLMRLEVPYYTLAVVTAPITRLREDCPNC